MVEFDWDQGNLNHLLTDNKDRGISILEVESVFSDPNAIYMENKLAGDTLRYFAVGKSLDSRLLTIIFEIRYDKIRPITAWPTKHRGKAKRLYDENLRKKESND